MKNEPWALKFSVHELSKRRDICPNLVKLVDGMQKTKWRNQREIEGSPKFMNVFLFCEDRILKIMPIIMEDINRILIG